MCHYCWSDRFLSWKQTSFSFTFFLNRFLLHIITSIQLWQLFLCLYILQKVNLCFVLFNDTNSAIKLVAICIELLANISSYASQSVSLDAKSCMLFYFRAMFLPAFTIETKNSILRHSFSNFSPCLTLNPHFFFSQLFCSNFYAILCILYEDSSQHPIFHHMLMFTSSIYISTFLLFRLVPHIHMWFSFFIFFATMSDMFMFTSSFRFCLLLSTCFMTLFALSIFQKWKTFSEFLRMLLPLFITALPHSILLMIAVKTYNFQKIKFLWEHLQKMHISSPNLIAFDDFKNKIAILRCSGVINHVYSFKKHKIAGNIFCFGIPQFCFRIFCLYQMILHFLFQKPSFPSCANLLVTSAEIFCVPYCFSIYQLLPYSEVFELFDFLEIDRQEKLSKCYRKLLQSRAFFKVLMSLRFSHEKGLVQATLTFLVHDFYIKRLLK